MSRKVRVLGDSSCLRSLRRYDPDQVRGSRAQALLSARLTGLPVHSNSCNFYTDIFLLLCGVYRTMLLLSSRGVIQ